MNLFSYKAFLTFFHTFYLNTERNSFNTGSNAKSIQVNNKNRYWQEPIVRTIVRRCQVSTAVNCSGFQLYIQAENEIQSRRIRMPIFSIDFMRICFKKFSSGDSLDIFEFHIGMEYPQE